MKVSKTQEYIVALLEGREFIEKQTVTKEQLQILWKEGKISRETISISKWKSFADAWNTENSTHLEYMFPQSIERLISIL